MAKQEKQAEPTKEAEPAKDPNRERSAYDIEKDRQREANQAWLNANRNLPPPPVDLPTGTRRDRPAS